ncbi:MAG: vWA domain-containing protein [Planctomycetota bacterium]
MTFDPQQNDQLFQGAGNKAFSQARSQMSVPRSGVSRPAWLSQSSKQVAVLVRDCSGSMGGAKAIDATAASQGLVDELADPANRGGFEAAVINFESSGSLVNDVTPATELAGRVTPIHGGGGTNVASGLKIAAEVLGRSNFQSEDYLRPVVVVFSDGQTSDRDKAKTLATSIKAGADLVSVAFGTNADEDFLRSIATSPEHFYRCNDGRSLRAFFAAVGATMCTSLQRGQNATQALSQVRF